MCILYFTECLEQSFHSWSCCVWLLFNLNYGFLKIPLRQRLFRTHTQNWQFQDSVKLQGVLICKISYNGICPQIHAGGFNRKFRNYLKWWKYFKMQIYIETNMSELDKVVSNAVMFNRMKCISVHIWIKFEKGSREQLYIFIKFRTYFSWKFIFITLHRYLEERIFTSLLHKINKRIIITEEIH